MTAIFEGISFLILLFIAMPLKYLADMPHGVMIVGWLHGLLFILYLLTAYLAMKAHDWTLKKSSLAVVASLIPFGPFMFDRYFLQGDTGRRS